MKTQDMYQRVRTSSNFCFHSLCQFQIEAVIGNLLSYILQKSRGFTCLYVDTNPSVPNRIILLVLRRLQLVSRIHPRVAELVKA